MAKNNIKLDEDLKMYLTKLLNERYYATMDYHELGMISRLYEVLGVDGEAWLSSREEY